MAYSTIDKPNSYFDTQLFTGTNTSGRTFTGLNFQPDMIWGKTRDSANYNHFIVDNVRGGTKFIATNTTAAEDTASHGQITSWNSDGTTWSDGTNGTYPRLYYNDNGQLGGSGSRVWWQWKANGAGSSNTSGSITSTVSANTTSGFSIVSWTGTGANGTVGHGLSNTPSMIITKARSSYGSDAWYVVHTSVWGNDGNGLVLNNSASLYNRVADLGGTGITAWSSSTFTINQGSATFLNNTSIPYIGYCWSTIKGYSAFGKYTGNGSTDGPFIYTGFKPAFLLIKPSNGAYNWTIIDNKRNTYNVTTLGLIPNTTSADTTGSGSTYNMDLLSNGFKNRYSSNELNGSLTYIYAAFAENPFTSSKGIPTTAR